MPSSGTHGGNEPNLNAADRCFGANLFPRTHRRLNYCSRMPDTLRIRADQGTSVRDLYQQTLRRTGGLLFQAAGYLRPADPLHTILLFGSHRSGTTWLLEILRALPGYKALTEPLSPMEAGQFGFVRRGFIDRRESRPRERSYIQGLVQGRPATPFAWHFSHGNRFGQLSEYLSNRKMIIKFCHANRMMHWILDGQRRRGAVFLVRHPCAVVASQIVAHERSGREPTDRPIVELIRASGTHPHWIDEQYHALFDSIDSWAGVLAVAWALDQFVPLLDQAEGDYPWILVPYERLVRHGESELQRICEYLDVEPTERMRALLTKPSTSVRDPLHDRWKKQLSKWRRKLTEEQIEDVFEVVEAFGLDFYSRELEPDYDPMNVFQDSEAAW